MLKTACANCGTMQWVAKNDRFCNCCERQWYKQLKQENFMSTRKDNRTSDTKFVTFNGYNGLQIIVFPCKIQHRNFANSIHELSYGTMEAVSGGFVLDGECVGNSISLRMEATARDTALLQELKAL